MKNRATTLQNRVQQLEEETRDAKRKCDEANAVIDAMRQGKDALQVSPLHLKMLGPTDPHCINRVLTPLVPSFPLMFYFGVIAPCALPYQNTYLIALYIYVQLCIAGILTK